MINKASCFIIVALIMQSCLNNSQKTAELYSKNDSISLGDIIDSSRFYFTIYCRGNDTLKLLKIASGCGCTKVVSNKEKILPGDSAILTGVYIPESKGAFEKSIVINTNTQKKFHVLRIRGTAKSIRTTKEKHP